MRHGDQAPHSSATILQYTFRSQFVVNHNIFISFCRRRRRWRRWYDSYGTVINLSSFLISFISSYFFLSFGKPRESFLLFFQMINRKLFDFVAFAIGHQMYHIPSIKSSAHSGIFHIAISIRCRCFHLEILGNM